MKKKFLLIGLALLLAGGTFYGIGLSTKNSNEIVAEEINQDSSFEERFTEAVFELNYEPKQLGEMLLENISTLNEEEVTNAVHTILYVLSSNLYTLNQDADFLADIASYEEQGKDKSDQALVTEIEYLEDNYFEVIDRDGQTCLEINYPAIIDQFGEYVTIDFKELLAYYSATYARGYWTEPGVELDYEELAYRSELTQELADKYPSSEYMYGDFMKELETFYYELIFGNGSDQYVFDEDGKIKGSALEAYSKILAERKESRLTEKVKQLLDKLEEVDYVKNTDLEVFLMDLCGVEYEAIETDSSEEVEEVLESIEQGK